MKISNFVLIPPRCTAEESAGHWRDFFALAGVSVVGVFVVPDIASNALSGTVAVMSVSGVWIAAIWATIATMRRVPGSTGPQPTARLEFTRAWLAHMWGRISRVRDRFRELGVGGSAVPRDS